jgi:hypothetical protein
MPDLESTLYFNKETSFLHFSNKKKISPYLKKGDKKDPTNYREISSLNTCYKIYSKIVNRELEKYSEQFMSEAQNGF